MTFLKGFTDNDPQRMEMYIKMYIRYALEATNAMNEHLKKKDWDQLQRAGHELLPMLDYMGIKCIRQTVRAIGKGDFNRKSTSKLASDISEVERVCNESYRELEKYLETSVGKNTKNNRAKG